MDHAKCADWVNEYSTTGSRQRTEAEAVAQARTVQSMPAGAGGAVDASKLQQIKQAKFGTPVGPPAPAPAAASKLAAAAGGGSPAAPSSPAVAAAAGRVRPSVGNTNADRNKAQQEARRKAAEAEKQAAAAAKKKKQQQQSPKPAASAGAAAAAAAAAAASSGGAGASWTKEEQAALEKGLKEFPAALKDERWASISAVVGTRSPEECKKRCVETAALSRCI